jgi:hypothetical protein
MEARFHSSSFGARDCIGEWQQLCTLGVIEIMVVYSFLIKNILK